MRRPFLTRSFWTEKTEITKSFIQTCVVTGICRHPIDQIPVTVIIPLTGRSDAMHRFLRIFENLVSVEDEALNLVIVDFPNGNSDTHDESFKQLKSDLYSLEKRLPTSRIELIKEDGEFSRGKGLQIGGLSQGADELLFFCDIDMAFDQATLKRIRHETIKVLISIFFKSNLKFSEQNCILSGDIFKI
mgnify:CR=1 FL=1